MTATAWDFPDPHILKVRVQAGDIDLMQHTNNVVYLRWLEEIAWDHSRHLGLDEAAYERLGHGMVARRHELDYLLPTHLGEEIWLATWILRSDRLSIRRGYQFLRPGDGATVFRGRTHWVCVDIKEGRVRRMPAEFQAAYVSPLQIEET
ncbi:MAG: acyl-CoA thioesterase [Moraxellaceae bacterium]|jgi:acyl-CoA thioester hydrolase|nr:acyl-CoA thioesterase [Moraxellaceae bacterium]